MDQMRENSKSKFTFFIIQFFHVHSAVGRSCIFRGEFLLFLYKNEKKVSSDERLDKV